MGLYGGLDVHSSNTRVGVMEGDGRRVYERRLDNDPKQILGQLHPMKADIVGLVVESTYNWYWLVDGLMEGGYRVHLANPSGIQRYKGLKHSDDRHDAFWLAEMLRLAILPEGYIYPKEERPVRDLLRKRGHLVRLRTSLILSLQNIIARNCGVRVGANEVKRLREDRVSCVLDGQQEIALAGRASKETIDFLTHQICRIERRVEGKVKLKESYRHLLTLPGVGRILALTIMLETGPISRFPKVGDYVSYCRKVSSHWTSNDKNKGKGNQRSGNRYLAWAFSEAAEYARRYHLPSRAYYNRKLQKTNLMVARSALSHKLARAAYYVMRDQVFFMAEKLFA